MRIFRIPVGNKFQPNHQGFIWPPQNAQQGGDMGVEQDFNEWLSARPYMLTDNPGKADWMYIPIYWNRYYINTPDEDGAWGGGVQALVDEIDRCNEYNLRKFTIAEADVKWLKPQIRWKDIVVFCASRRDYNGGIDIPLLSAPRPTPDNIPEKKWLASFLGNLKTDGIRIDMHENLRNRKDCRVENAGAPMNEFTMTMLESYIALCPRGQGAQSFRMYEAMQLGIVPMYISDMDCRPFKKWIDWELCSLYSPTANVSEYLDVMKADKDTLLFMGERAKRVYMDYLGYGKWCKFVLRELELL